MERNLTARQIEFCRQYVLSCNAADAVRKAGYRCKSPAAYGYRLLQNPRIQEYLNYSLAEAADKRVAEAGEILEFYTMLMRGDFGDGVEVKLADRLKAADALAKIFGLFSDYFGEADRKAVTIVDDVQ